MINLKWAFSVLVIVGLDLTMVSAEDRQTAIPSGDGITESSIVYKTVSPNRQLRIDITQPSDASSQDQNAQTPRPGVVFFHGGGWTGGKPGQFAAHSRRLAKLGMVCFRVEYRLLKGKPQAKPDMCIEDASDAFRLIRNTAADYGLDPNRLAAGGGSAGGHLAAFLGMMDDEIVDGVSRKPNALLLFNPVYDNGPGGWGTARIGDDYLKYSPRHNLSADDPPAIVFLGTNDKLIPVSTAEAFRDESRQLGLTSELHLYEGRPHGFFNSKKGDIGKDYLDTMDKTIAFLRELDWIETGSDDS